VHPFNAISAGVVEPAVGFDHHLQAHHEAEGVFAVPRRSVAAPPGSAGGCGYSVPTASSKKCLMKIAIT
jgi:hypothetical protein